MNVICRECGKLVPEDEVIKMSMVEYKRWQTVIYDIPFMSYFPNEYNIYTQICEGCYKKAPNYWGLFY
uniref:Uncharacterized protein n=1 Tax=viral metagenome TaxID=1070528 RepID=A0A6H1ZYM6_9ZZZZ